MSGSARSARRLAPATLYVHERASVLIPLPFLDIPATLTLVGLPWHRKHEFHVTAAHTPSIAEHLAEQLGLASDAAEAAAWETARAAAAGASIGTVTLSDDLLLVRRGDERTLVVLCEVEGLHELFAGISRRLAVAVEPPPAHATLYTAPGGESIGIHTRAQLDRDAVALDPPDAAELHRALEEFLA